jgi:hypothetical protein
MIDNLWIAQYACQLLGPFGWVGSRRLLDELMRCQNQSDLMVLASCRTGLASRHQECRQGQDRHQADAENNDKTLGHRKPGKTHSATSLTMQLFMRLVVEGAIVKTFFGRQFYPFNKFYVCAFVHFMTLAGGEIANKKTDRSPGCWFQGLVLLAVNEQSTVAYDVERETGVEIIAFTVEGQVPRRCGDACQPQNPLEGHSATPTAGINPAHIGYLPHLIHGRQIRPAQFTTRGDFTFDSQ